MRELLLVFILALIVGSILNGWQQKQPLPAGTNSAVSSNSTTAQPGSPESGATTGATNGSASLTPTKTGAQRDFPDFNSFPALTQNNFNEIVLSSDKPVFVVCYTPNSLAYERMVPLIAAVAKEHEDTVKIARLNILVNPNLAQTYEVFSVPTYLVFSKGQLTTKWSGVVAKERLEAMIATAKP